MERTRLACVLATFALLVLGQSGSNTSVAQDRSHLNLTRPNPASTLGSDLVLSTIDAKTRWAFRALSPVTVSSPIIRLGDVSQPLDPNMAGWARFKRSPIGLVPLDGQPMTIQRDRLTTALRDAEATPLAIDWIGPAKIQVIYKKSDPAIQQASAIGQQQNDLVQASATESTLPLLTERESTRILHWIDLAIERQLPSIHEHFDIQYDPRQPSLAVLRPMAGVTEVRAFDAPTDGPARFQVTARSVDGPITTQFVAELIKHPMFSVPRASLPRGHRIAASDLIQRPFPDSEANSAFITDASQIIGKEVRSNVRRGQPIRPSDIGSPILIHRGDLVEIQVHGGGIKVSTNAKAVGEGAESDLIEVDTLRPRKRYVARVVQPGVVEIVTRPPNVR
ncbi:MAG: flagellar basal body P-ring formation chaperone FlgA [Rubripirellula sp.]